MEPPECPICLQSYDGAAVVPRVLACGHTACGECLSQLPRPFSIPAVVRCPACTQIVHFPHPLGAEALPKNIDLLRFSLQLLDDKHSSERNPSCSPIMPEQRSNRRSRLVSSSVWSDEVYTTWKGWIFPRDSVSIVRGGKEVSSYCDVEKGRVLGFGSDFSSVSAVIRRVKDDQEVNLVRIGRFDLNDSASALEYGYAAKIMCVLSRMNGSRIRGLDSVLMLPLRCQLRICDIYGVWLDEECGSLYLVSERKSGRLFDLDDELSSIALQEEEDGDGLCKSMEDRVYGLAAIGVELCEALIGLQSEGFVCGCLCSSCLRLDEFGHVYVDLSEVIVAGRKLRKCISMAARCTERMSDAHVEELIESISKIGVFLSPEVIFELLRIEGVNVVSKCTPNASSDVWALSCIFVRFVAGNHFVERMFKYLSALFKGENGEPVHECETLFMNWVLTVSDMLETAIGVNFKTVKQILVNCLDFNQQNRPSLTDLWNAMKQLTFGSGFDHRASLGKTLRAENIQNCAVLCQLLSDSDECKVELRMGHLQNGCSEGAVCSTEEASEMTQEEEITQSLSQLKVSSTNLQQHRDCVTALTVGGGFLFSCSLDKTIQVRSMEDFTHVHTLRGPEHRIMSVVFVNEDKPICISGDSGGGIFVWGGSTPFCQEPLKKWYEEKDWRYSGIYALAAPGTGYVYSGGGDRLIKVWSLLDCSLLCTMEGHRSVVSTLAISNGVLHSGSWDGTVRLWNLHDHTPLAVLGVDASGTSASIHSLYANDHTIVAAHENGFVKIWLDDEFKRSIQVHDGAVFAVGMEGKSLFTGGWDKSVKVQEIQRDGVQLDLVEVGSIACDSVITSLLCEQGELIVGCANGSIKKVLGKKVGWRKYYNVKAGWTYYIKFSSNFLSTNFP